MAVTCSCKGLKTSNCICAENHTETKSAKPDQDITKAPKDRETTETKPLAKLSKCNSKTPRNSLNKFLENLYIKCATYNIKCCPFYTSIGHRNYFINTLRDVGILFCFLAANLVIFFIIAARMTMDIMLVVFECGKWIYR